MHRFVVLFALRTLLTSIFIFQGLYAMAQQTVPPDDREPPGDTIGNPGEGTEYKPDSVQALRLQELERRSDLKKPISYGAEDFMLLDMEAKTLYLHKKGALKYDEMTLDADSVAISLETNQIHADGLLDSTGQKKGLPVFHENDQNYRADRMAYNFKSKKGLVTMARTKQDDSYIIGEYVKKQDDSTYYIQNGKFTSCELDHPHYYIRSSKLKVIPRSRIITGPLMLVIEDFPLPLVVPFGFFPNQTGHRSGVVMPTYGESAERGFFLRNGGYYFAISDHMDLLLRGDVFSKGGYRLEIGSAYSQRYRYDGKFQVEYGVQRFGEKDDPAEYYKRTSNFLVRWDHNQVINPQARLTASVKAGSSGFLKSNSYNEQDYLTNTLKSTVNFSQSFANSPWRMNLNLEHSQNTQTRQVSMDLPNITLNRTRFFPFKFRNATGNRWYQKIGVNYTASARNQINVTDSLIPMILQNPTGLITYQEVNGRDTSLVTRKASSFFNNGILQTIPLSTQVNVAKYINILTSVNYREYWYFRTRDYAYHPGSRTVGYTERDEFTAARDFSASATATTRVYGIFGGGGKRQSTYRHTITPNVGYTYKPDFSDARWGYYQTVQADSTGKTGKYNRLAGGNFGSPSAGEQQMINFGLSNLLEMKYRSKEADKDTTQKADPWKRINLLDALQFNGSYNFAADSLRLSPFSFLARTNFLNNKFSFQIQGDLDPYAVNSSGRRINVLRYEKNGSIGRLSDFSLAFNTSLVGKKSGGPTLTSKTATPEDLTDFQVYRDLYVDFNIPWKLNLTTNLRYSNTGIRRDTTLTVNLSGDIGLTPKWKIGYTTGYDFMGKDLTYSSFSIYRDLHCWEMAMTWIPFGQRKSYNFSLNVKSSTLKDLKLTKRRDWQDRF